MASGNNRSLEDILLRKRKDQSINWSLIIIKTKFQFAKSKDALHAKRCNAACEPERTRAAEPLTSAKFQPRLLIPVLVLPSRGVATVQDIIGRSRAYSLISRQSSLPRIQLTCFITSLLTTRLLTTTERPDITAAKRSPTGPKFLFFFPV